MGKENECQEAEWQDDMQLDLEWSADAVSVF